MISKSVSQTNEIAAQIWGACRSEAGKKAMVIALEGELGAGKTTFTKALAKQMGIKSQVVSPTYVLHIPHVTEGKAGNIRLEHIDAYRLEEWGEMLQIGLLKMIENNSVIVIEWADKFKSQIQNLKSQSMVIRVKMEYGEKERERRITFENIGN